MREPEGYLSARQAAAYVGYEPGPERDADGKRLPARDDKSMRAFYEWARRHSVRKHRRGRCLLFKRADLDRAIGQSTDEHDEQHQTRLERMGELARKHAAGEVLHA